MIHQLIFSGLFLLIVLAQGIFYYRRKMMSKRSLFINVSIFLVLTVLICVFIIH
ncbi:hypothetical protein HDF24_00350 [Mucilaginibacter sp. X4EP1]|uniref:hypothetical protein n=1 Tax=Mucilaginibacter sp. X4EP1 TaxID=2723092 RepID=UPI0021685582|nr:hypothetical protein [Mucilaginibacter sp. X4EP1]MCS3811459.1 hypothetical protein [Mucilaginibacter sp. X4EP1]